MQYMANIKHRYSEVEKIDAAAFKIKHKDYFNWKGLYFLMHEWLFEEGYAPRGDEDFKEIYYMHRETQTAGKEIWIYWRLQKFPFKNPFMRYDFDVDVHLVGVKDAEIMYEGKKFKVDWGEPEIKVWANVILDYKLFWGKNKLFAPFMKIYYSRIVKGLLEKHKKVLYKDAYRFQEAVKTHLKLSTYLPEIEGQEFYDKKMVP